jgi:Nickel responsive protein SCO4226-like
MAGRKVRRSRQKEVIMQRYLVERTFPGGLQIPATDEGARACLDVMARNGDFAVTWVHSYVSDDNRTTYCIYDAPSPEAIRQAAACNGLPVDRITRVSVLDPYFHR